MSAEQAVHSPVAAVPMGVPVLASPMGAPIAYPSFGMTSTPKLGWGCCTLAPCCACDEVYFSDNHKTWGETGKAGPCCPLICCCTDPYIENVRVVPGGQPYKYTFKSRCFGICEPDVKIEQSNSLIGTAHHECYCCPCDKTRINVMDNSGKSVYTTRYPGCCGVLCCCCGGGGCCGGRCCDCWQRWMVEPVYGPDGAPPVMLTSVVNQYHCLCPCLYPSWVGYDQAPTVIEDQMALLAVFFLKASSRRPGRAVSMAAATI